MTCVHAKSLSHVQLFVTPWTVAHQAPLSMGFSRQEYWSGLPFLTPGDLPDPGIKPLSPSLAGGFFTTSATWEAFDSLIYHLSPCLLPILGYRTTWVDASPEHKAEKTFQARGNHTSGLPALPGCLGQPWLLFQVIQTPDSAMEQSSFFFIHTARHIGAYAAKGVHLTKAPSLSKMCGSASHLQMHKHRLPRAAVIAGVRPQDGRGPGFLEHSGSVLRQTLSRLMAGSGQGAGQWLSRAEALILEGPDRPGCWRRELRLSRSLQA